MRLLDLYCSAGGAAVGYHRAGFDVVGVDIEPQPNFPYEFVQADAIHYAAEHWREFDAIHASPPCQHFSAMSNSRPGLAATYPDLVAATRGILELTGLPWVMENVPGSPLTTATDLFGAHGTVLCGHMFGLKLYRHRIFETSFGIYTPGHPAHLTPASKAGHWVPGTIISVAGNLLPHRRREGGDGRRRLDDPRGTLRVDPARLYVLDRHPTRHPLEGAGRMTRYIEQQSDAQFRAWLRTRNASEVRLDRAAHMTDEELRMVAAARQDAA